MKFIIIGAGAVGTNLSQRLATGQHDVVLIERFEHNIDKVAASLDVEILLGNGAQPELLAQAGIATADYVISVADNDAVNIAACLAAKLLNPRVKRIARIRDINFLHKDIAEEHVREYFDLIINPDQAAADYFMQLFKVPGAKEVVDFCDGKLRVLALSIAENSKIAGTQIKNFTDLQDQFPLLIIAILRRNKLIVPRARDTIQEGDLVYFVTVPEKTNVLFEICGRSLARGRSAMIWGGNFLGRSLVRSLEAQGIQVKFIISNPELALEVVDEFEDTLILHGSGTDQNLLVEENISEIDAFVAVTPDEENNILGSLLAKRLGVPLVMSLINKNTYLNLVHAIGIDVAVSSQVAAAKAIFHHIHSEAVISEFSLRNLGAGFIEIEVSSGMPITGKTLAEIKSPHGVIFSAIVRGGQVIIPRGSDLILAGDRLVLFVLNTAQKKIEKLLGMKLEFFI